MPSVVFEPAIPAIKRQQGHRSQLARILQAVITKTDQAITEVMGRNHNDSRLQSTPGTDRHVGHYSARRFSTQFP